MFFALCFGIFQVANAQEKDIIVENELNTWMELDVSKKLSRDIRLVLTPEIRLDDNFNTDKLLLQGMIKYKPLKFLEGGGGYRLNVQPDDGAGKAELEQRVFFEVSTMTKLFRFEPEFRWRYTHDSGLGEDNYTLENLRYKGSLDYDIRKSKFTPSFSTEIFQSLTEHEVFKIRYELGGRYKINKKNSIKLDYKLDYYLSEYKNRHIIGLSYKIKI